MTELLRESIRESVRVGMSSALNESAEPVNESLIGVALTGTTLAALGYGWYKLMQKNVEKILKDIRTNEAIDEELNKKVPDYNNKVGRLMRLFKMSKSLDNVLQLEKEADAMISKLENAKSGASNIKVTRDDVAAGANGLVQKWMFRNREIDENQATKAAQRGYVKLIDDLQEQLRQGVEAAMTNAENASGGI